MQPDFATPEHFTSFDAELWRKSHEGSKDARERIFSEYLPFARSIAARHFRSRHGSDIEFEDLYQLAGAGLLEAIDRYDPSLGVPFRGFAARRISGSIRDGVGKLSELREQLRHRHRVWKERTRTFEVDADTLNKTEAMDAFVEMATGLALGFMLEGTSLYVGEEKRDAAPSAYESLTWQETIRRLSAELERLPERERQILRLHYLEDVSFIHIAALLGLTKGRIAQLHKSSLMLLAKRLRAAGGFRA